MPRTAPRDLLVTGYAPDLDGLEYASASYVRQSFPRHFHGTYSISVVEGGTGAVWCDGTNFTVPPAGLTLVNPGQVHTGGIASGATAMQYRVLYPSAALVQRFVGDESARSEPMFRRASVVDASLAPLVARAHRLLGEPTRALERDEMLLSVLRLLFDRHGDVRVARTAAARAESAGVRRVIEALHSSSERPTSLTAIAGLVGWTPAYLSRVFRRHVGMRPSAYLLQLRVEHGRRLLAGGATPVQAAVAAGFADQSHFTRAFRRWTGTTPAVFRAASLRRR
jgi:AraC-like DNA-binding protein